MTERVIFPWSHFANTLTQISQELDPLMEWWRGDKPGASSVMDRLDDTSILSYVPLSEPIIQGHIITFCHVVRRKDKAKWRVVGM